MKREAGFTLIELMIALVVLAIITAVALPSYRDYVTRGQLAEAYTNLADMSTKLEQFYQDNRSYVGACAAGTVAPLPGNLRYFAAACPTLTATTYVVQMAGLAGTSANGFTFTVDQAGNKVTVAVPAGWALPVGNCWVRMRGGSC